jgi:hypothetical protein
VEEAGRSQCQCVGQIPEKLVELPHDRKNFEHLVGGERRLPPIPSAEGDLGDLLPRAKAIIRGATSKTPRPEALVDTATEIRLQIRTGPPRGLVDREIHRS